MSEMCDVGVEENCVPILRTRRPVWLSTPQDKTALLTTVATLTIIAIVASPETVTGITHSEKRGEKRQMANDIILEK